MNEKWFAMSIEEIEKKLKTNAASGLSVKAADSRAQNKEAPFFSVKKKRWDRLLLDLFSDIFLVVLTFVAVFSLFFQGDYVIGSAMLLLIAVNVGVSFFIYYRDKRGIDSMSQFFTPTARVIRGGKLYVADYRDIAVGDVIIVERGDILGCDARLVHSDGLTVNMKLDKKNEKLLKKYAGAAVDENELHAENMTNMLHAGSTVKEGSGRAIVVAGGEYTYLGAITGGITEVPSGELPGGLAQLKKSFSRVGMFLLILMLPFCIFSLIFGHFTGGTTVLSEAVSVALAIGATAMLSRASDLFICFFARFIRKAALAENPCIIRSLKAFDDVADTDVLFMLDGSITTDGILHYDGLSTVDGVVDKYGRLGQSAEVLADTIAVYAVARRSSLSAAGVGVGGLLDTGIDEFLQRSRADTAAIKIRCTVHSFIPSADRAFGDILTYTDRGVRTEMSVSDTAAILDKCGYAVFAGNKKELSREGVETVRNNFNSLAAAGKHPIIFALKQDDSVCFVGMLILREGIDASASRSLSALRKNGVKIIAFSNCRGRDHAPEIPDMLRRGGCAYAEEFEKKGWPITQGFGSYDEYCGFDADGVAELARYVKSQNKKLTVMSFSEYASEAVAQADVFMTCAPVRASAYGKLDEEIRSLEIPGEQSSASCTQEVKAEADVLLMRPHGSKGGLEPLARIIEYCKIAYRNLKNYTVYLTAVSFLRIITVAFPMLFGNTVADARHILFLGYVFDLFALIVLAFDSRRAAESRKKLRKSLEGLSIDGLIRENSVLAISVLVGSVVTLLLPEIFGIFGVFGGYVHKAEFAFISMLLMQFLIFLCVYAGDLRNKAAMARLIRMRTMQIWITVSLAFTVLCLLTPMGDLFGVSRIPIFYLLLSVVPAVALGVCFAVMTVSKERNGAKARKM